MNSKEYLMEVKKRLPKQSDYALAKCLGIKQQTVSNYMNNKRIMDDTTALKVAKFLGEDPMKVIAAANADRETGEAKKEWENFYKQLGGMAASLLLGVNLVLTPSPAEAAPINDMRSELCILCKIIQIARRYISSIICRLKLSNAAFEYRLLGLAR